MLCSQTLQKQIQKIFQTRERTPGAGPGSTFGDHLRYFLGAKFGNNQRGKKIWSKQHLVLYGQDTKQYVHLFFKGGISGFFFKGIEGANLRTQSLCKICVFFSIHPEINSQKLMKIM